MGFVLDRRLTIPLPRLCSPSDATGRWSASPPKQRKTVIRVWGVGGVLEFGVITVALGSSEPIRVQGNSLKTLCSDDVELQTLGQ